MCSGVDSIVLEALAKPAVAKHNSSAAAPSPKTSQREIQGKRKEACSQCKVVLAANVKVGTRQFSKNSSISGEERKRSEGGKGIFPMPSDLSHIRPWCRPLKQNHHSGVSNKWGPREGWEGIAGAGLPTAGGRKSWHCMVFATQTELVVYLNQTNLVVVPGCCCSGGATESGRCVCLAS